MPDTAAVQAHLDPQQGIFRTEYEQELETWLRKRFRTVCIGYMILGGLVLIMRLFMIGFGSGQSAGTAALITIIFTAASLGVIAYYLFARQWTHATREQMLRAASTMILVLGAISVLKAVILIRATPDQDSDFLLPLFFWHFIACLFLPWTPRESLRPILPLLVAWMAGVLFLEPDLSLVGRGTKVILGPGILLPGLGICALRLQYHSENFRSRMMGKHFLSMRQEFARARRIHETMFPPQHDDGFVRFEYTYTPMRELGGDYVHLEVSPEGLVHLMLIDVTGHGLPSALTVNRLYGELERIRAESPLAEPGEVLSLLNRYIHLTMVKHNIFVTALCMTLDPIKGKLHWANAGHPPGFLRGVNGKVMPLPATSVILGALDSREFHADQRTIELSPGDVVIGYTDGTFEARDRLGESLGLQKLGSLLSAQPPPRNWPQFIAQEVQRHSGGRADDDILIAALTFKAHRPAPAESISAASPAAAPAPLRARSAE